MKLIAKQTKIDMASGGKAERSAKAMKLIAKQT
jgi:hypothetical protein